MMRTVFLRATPLALLAAIASSPSFAAQAEAYGALVGEVAADRLAAIGTGHSLALADAMRRQRWGVRRVEAQGAFSAPGAAEPLMLALRDPRPVVRRLAAWGLSELKVTEAQHQVAPLLEDAAPEVRGEAARALADIGARGYARRVAALLQDSSPHVRVQAAHALGDFQDPATKAPLQAALLDRDPSVKDKARWALRRVSEAEVILRRSNGR
jgi:HEAT repeat protein